MSRLRHKGSGKADGGVVSARGNPSILKLAKKGGNPGIIQGSDTDTHLGRASGGKIKAVKRGGGNPFSSAKLSNPAGHKDLAVTAKAPKDGVPGKGGK